MSPYISTFSSTCHCGVQWMACLTMLSICLVCLITLVICVKTINMIQTSLIMKATSVLRTKLCYREFRSIFCRPTLTLNDLPQLMADPAWSRWLWEAAESTPPAPGHWGQQSKCSTLRTPGFAGHELMTITLTLGLAKLVWTVIIISLKVTRIEYQERPHQHHLQQF